MKLSEKGANKILVNNVIRTPDGESYLILNDLIKTKFEPDDFQDAVILTVEEAKLCLRAIRYFNAFDAQTKSIKLLKTRIEQAEKNHE